MNVRSVGTTASLLVAALAIACSGAGRRSGFEEQSADPNEPDGSAQTFGDGVEAGAQGCSYQDDTDHDGDGLSYNEGDCNDCHPGIHPGFFDLPGNGVDEDCSGTPDDGDAQCDDNLDINASDPYDAAKAMGLCKKADPNKDEWGVVEARYVQPDGTPASVNLDVGILPKFGVNAPKAGKSLLALATGYARAPGDPGHKSGTGRTKGNDHGAPAGYPKEFAGCPAGVTTGEPQDGIGLELKIRVPKNAQSFTYEQNFFTYEYSTFVCTQWNDFFVTLLQPKLPDLPDENIAFDSLNNPISVNNGLLQACSPGTFKGKPFACPLGTGPLQGTGFENHGATGWLTTTAPVEGGKEITLRFAIWDSGDGAYDSTVLLDNFQWSVDPTGGPATAPAPK